jgi:glycosyltransferase involved in cell wall biosynthesis
MPRASFVMPAKNCQEFIKKTISSLTNQTEKDIEIIVVENDSTDNTLNILNDLAKSDPRIIIISAKNVSGIADCRNIGTKKASGQIILPVDADDPNNLKRVEISLSELKKNKADIFYGNMKRLYVDTNKSVMRHFQPFDSQLLHYINFIAHGASAFYKYVYDKIGEYDSTIEIGEDYDFFLTGQELGYKFCSKNVALAQYTMHSGQITAHASKEQIKRRQKWNEIVRKKHGIYKIDLDYVKKHAELDVIDFYINKNYETWFGQDSIPEKAK